MGRYRRFESRQGGRRRRIAFVPNGQPAQAPVREVSVMLTVEGVWLAARLRRRSAEPPLPRWAELGSTLRRRRQLDGCAAYASNSGGITEHLIPGATIVNGRADRGHESRVGQRQLLAR